MVVFEKSSISSRSGWVNSCSRSKAMLIILTKKESIPAVTENVLCNYNQVYVFVGKGIVRNMCTVNCQMLIRW
ncbi:hypothetical protein [Halobacillus faecis]